MEYAPDALADAQLLDVEGQPHRLGDLWKSRPALLMFVRHFG
ncbi:MAG TPA: hypothetical protein VII38_13800 [Polyangia bacterium]